MLRAAEARDGAIAIPRRRELLAQLASSVVRHREALAEALRQDTGGRSRLETLLADVLVTVEAARHARRHVRRWARPRRVSVPYAFQPARAWEEPVPKGIVGIIAPWNYPIQLALVPIVDAVAAGNRVALKPSEAVPRTATLLAALVEEALGPDIARTVLGGSEVAAEFARQRWDHLMFTGGTETGRKVAMAAAANLVPVTLELGGKCPVLVLPGADLARAAREILAGKAINAGQTCVAPDTVLLVGHSRAAFEAACRAARLTLPESPVATEAAVARLEALAAGARLTPLGPDGPGRLRALSLAEAPPGSALDREEIFGPVLAVEEAGTLEEAIAWIGRHPRPLAIYLFGATRHEERHIRLKTRSGAIVAGRTVEYAAFPDLGFGGSGASGLGRTHGLRGFETFSELRAHVRHGRWSLSRLCDLPRKRFSTSVIERLVARQ